MKTLSEILLKYLYKNLHLVDLFVVSECMRARILKYIIRAATKKTLLLFPYNTFLGTLYHMKLTKPGGPEHIDIYDKIHSKINTIGTVSVGINLRETMQALNLKYEPGYFVGGEKLTDYITGDIEGKLYFIISGLHTKHLAIYNSIEIRKLRKGIKKRYGGWIPCVKTLHRNKRDYKKLPADQSLEDKCIHTLSKNTKYISFNIPDPLVDKLIYSLVHNKLYPKKNIIIALEQNVLAIVYLLYPDHVREDKQHGKSIYVLKSQIMFKKRVRERKWEDLGIRHSSVYSIKESLLSSKDLMAYRRVCRNPLLCVDKENATLTTVVKNTSGNSVVKLNTTHIVRELQSKFPQVFANIEAYKKNES